MTVTMDGVAYSLGGKLPARAGLSAQYMLVRTLVGGGAISRPPRRRQYSQQLDLSCWPCVRQSKKSSLATAEFLKEHTGRSVGNFISTTIIDNRRLFSEILAEISNYFCATAMGAHASAFVFLYRALERLSFSIPLLYCTVSRDFHGTFSDLKKLFDEGAGGDLSLLKKFINGGRFLDRTIVDTTTTIDFSGSANACNFYEAVTSRYSDTYSCDPTRQQISVKFGKMQGLLETIRNRFFHFRSGDGKNNISAKELGDVDDFFRILNPHFDNFISKLILQTIVIKYRR